MNAITAEKMSWLRIDDTLENKISYYHISLFLISLPFNRFYSQIILASLILHVAFHFKKSQLKKLRDTRILTLQLVFFLTVAGTIYSPQLSQAFEDWNKQMAILIFPVLLAVIRLDLQKYRDKLLYIFSINCILVVIYLFADAIRIIRFHKLPINELLTPAFTSHNFSLPLDIHATYLSMYVALSMVFLLVKLFQNANAKWLHIIGAVVLACGLAALSTKSILVALILMGALIPAIFNSKRTTSKLTWAVPLALFGIVITVFFLSGNFKDRFLTDLETNRPKNAESGVTDSRMERWHAALDLIQRSPVIGYGSGSEVSILKNKYFEKKLYYSFLHELNAHNQYLSCWLKWGIIGIAAYVFSLWFSFRKAITSGDILFFSFMILIAVVALSENILDVNKGVFFYSSFLSLFIFSSPEFKTQKSALMSNQKPEESVLVISG